MSKHISPFEKEIIIDFYCNNDIISTAVCIDFFKPSVGVSIKSKSEINKNRKKSLNIARGRALHSSNTYNYENFQIGMPRSIYPFTMETEHIIIKNKLEKLLTDYDKIKDKKHIKIDITDEVTMKNFELNPPLQLNNIHV